METEKIKPFNIIGISVRTTNENMQAAKDIPLLWQKFISEGILEKIPEKLANTIYCIYTHYEKDFRLPYTTILGCKVGNLDTVPKGMIGLTIQENNYVLRKAIGKNLPEMIFKEWVEIWNSDILRAYTADFEVYDARSQDVENPEVEIYIAVK